MVYRGTIQGGCVVLPAEVMLPDGTEVVVAMPDQQPGSAVGPETWQTPDETGGPARTTPVHGPPVPADRPSREADHPAGRTILSAEPRSYPVADFLSPIEYAWDADSYAAEEAVRAYLGDCHADH